MLLVVDVGNTNITYGVYEEDNLITTFRMMSKTPRTSDEYGIMIREMLSVNKVDHKVIDGCIVVSVVPNIMHSLMSGIVRYIYNKPMLVGSGIKTGIKIVTENPKEIGPDRIVDAVGAYEKYGGPVFVLDFGTATTYDLVTAAGEFAAGITAPGLRISAKALWEDTAKLPEIEIKKPKSILAQETISSMQAGLVYGQIGQTEYIIDKVREESGLKDMKVIATGGLGRIISDETNKIDIYDSNLTLDGLRLIYAKNRH
ncbi:MAG: type III pantothenate kinase [Lachnospiraceae bacterium]|nr:type III pantothenate kinase [Lachnospiraceae bacterium]